VELVRDLLIFIAVMFALCIVLILVMSMLPNDNPLKRILTALSYGSVRHWQRE
jgi:ABC-type dipeptide/oligopeptide/nickel transport system permease component